MQNIISNFDSISKEDMTQYAGKWVAVIDCKIVAHGNSFKEVFEFVKKNYPNERPLMGKLPEQIPMILSVS